MDIFSLSVVAAILWDAVWKGIALWNAARRNQKYWYIAILVLNTVGVLPIVYLVIHRNKAIDSG